MASTLFLPSTLSLLFLLSLLSTAASITDPELQSILSSLRSKGYNLFGNAITTSDIRYELLAGSSFTFFAPTDGSLFALDMTAPASLYVSSLRYHIVYRRFSISDLRSLRSGSTLTTLLPKHELTIGRKRSPDSESDSDAITIDGVDVLIPGLYYGKNIAVHGLNGILDHRSRNRSSVNQAESPRSSDISISPESHGGDSSFLAPEFGNTVNPTSSPPLSHSSSVSPVGVPSSGSELDRYSDSDLEVDSDPGGDYGKVQTGTRGNGQCDEDESKCGFTEDHSWVIEGGVSAAMTPESSSSSDGKRKDGRDL